MSRLHYGNEAYTSEEKGTEFNYQCGKDLLTHHVKEKNNRTIKRAAKQVPRDKATSSLSPAFTCKESRLRTLDLYCYCSMWRAIKK